MSEIDFELKGWQAIIIIPIILILVVFQYFRLQVNLDEKAREPIKQYLYTIYSGQLGHDLTKIDPENITEEQSEEILEKARNLQKIDIVRLKAKRKGSRKVIARVEYLLDGKTAPDGKKARYFLIEKRMVGNWRVEHETSSLSYLLTLW